MNKKYLKENNLYEAHKQFMKLCEFTYVPSSLEEEDDQMDNQMMGGEQGQDPMMGGNEQQDMGMPPMDNQMMGGEQQDMGMPPMDDSMMDGEEEEVIDVEELTDAQEKMNDKVNLVGRNLEGFDSKIEALMQSIQKMESMIDANNQEIAAFKQEFEKRNPTQTEKLNLRSLDSYPFNVNPKDYWNGKGIDPNGNYSAIANNSIPTSQEYEITNSDVDNFDNKVVEDSFDINDDMIQDLKKIFEL